MRRNVVEVDAGSSDALQALLATDDIRGVPVCAKEPPPRNQSSGLVFGVYGRRTAEELLAAAESTVPMVSASVSGSPLALRFAAPTPPAFTTIFKRRLAVGPCRPRPLPCAKCASLEHVIEVFRVPACCTHCGGPHEPGNCAT
ncbi:uncharacterized protein LOC144105190 [Amblyomma americanum]